MTTMYTDNIDKWRSLSDIDYFTYFVKSWISFNAWYKNAYPDLKTDRDAINEIKSSPRCSFRKRFLSLLNGNNEESNYFKSNFAHFHFCLLNNHIEYNGYRLYFENFMVELKRNNSPRHDEHRKIKYYVSFNLNRVDIREVTATITDSKGNNLLNYQHSDYDLEHLESDKKFNGLSDLQQRKIKGLLEEANPKKKISLLTTSEPCLRIGNYQFINNDELIFKATIEILYNLRNALFHGEIVPNKETNKVYEQAYRIMRQLVINL